MMMNYRLAGQEDVPAIQQLLEALAASLGEADLYRGSCQTLVQHGFGDQPCFEVMLALNEDQAMGLCLYFREFSTWRGEPGVYVQDLYVRPEMQGQSIGRKLLSRVAAHTARHWQCTFLRLAVHDDNHSARQFYSHLGLTAETESHCMKTVGPAFQDLAAAS